MKKIAIIMVTVVMVMLIAIVSHADTSYTLANGNSTATINSSTNMWSWYVDGVSQLYEQDWWIRIGDDGSQYRLGELLSPAWTQLSNNALQATFTGSGLTITATYTLLGGVVGSNTADIGEQLLINNTSGKKISIFQYCDFNLGNTKDDDSVIHANPYLMKQWDENWIMQESVVPSANWEIGPYNTILSKLQSQTGLQLSNTVSPFGPADVTYAWQWDTTATSFVISKDKHISSAVPEPMSIILGIMGLTSVAGFGKLRRK